MKAEVYISTEELIECKNTNIEETFPISFSQLSGNGYSGVKGSGSDLYGIREFIPGDNIKRINRQATARTGKIYLNEYLEERMLSAYILLDQSSNMFFTSTAQMKSVLAAKTAAKILYRYLQKGHRVGGEVFNHIEFSDFMATTNISVCEEWLDKVAEFNKSLINLKYNNNKNILEQALIRCLDKNLSGREIYVITDLLTTNHSECMSLLHTLSHHNRIYMIQITDKMEDYPPIGVNLESEAGCLKLKNEKERIHYTEQRMAVKKLFIDFARQNDFSYHELFT